jgi:predicted O-linked N-acetylglucosamine transferase (SPINDLY family)
MKFFSRIFSYMFLLLHAVFVASESGAAGAVVLDPRSDAYRAYTMYNAALEEGRAGRLLASIAMYERCLALKPDLIEAINNLGGALNEAGRSRDAYDMYARGVALLRARGPRGGDGAAADDVRAEDRYMAASYQNNLGHIEQGYPNAARNRTAMARARAHFERAVAYFPQHTDALFNLGFAIERMGGASEAQGLYARVLALSPGHPSANLNVGNFHHKRGRLERAAAHHRAVAFHEGVEQRFRTAACNNLGQVLSEANDYEGALEAYGAGLRLAPEDALTLSHAAIARRMLCDWARRGALGALRLRLDERIEDCLAAKKPDPGMLPYDALFLPDEWAPPVWRRAVGRAQMRALAPMRGSAAAMSAGADAERDAAARATCGGRRQLRVAYLSYDFREHPMGFLTLGLLESHAAAASASARERPACRPVLATAFSYGKDDASALRARLAAAVGAERFVELRDVESDVVAARAVAGSGADIVVDLMAHTKGSRLGIIAAQRPAHAAAQNASANGRLGPIVVNYLGFPGSLGSDDGVAAYAVGDRYVVAPEWEVRGGERREFSEKLVLLPHSYQINAYRELLLPSPLLGANPSASAAAKNVPSRPRAVVLANYNKLDKLEPRSWGAWMGVLRRYPRAVLHLVNPGARARRRIRANLWREAAARGIAPSRVVFVPRMKRREHLVRVAGADIFLDTFRCVVCRRRSSFLPSGVCCRRPFATRSRSASAHACRLRSPTHPRCVLLLSSGITRTQRRPTRYGAVSRSSRCRAPRARSPRASLLGTTRTQAFLRSWCTRCAHSSASLCASRARALSAAPRAAHSSSKMRLRVRRAPAREAPCARSSIRRARRATYGERTQRCLSCATTAARRGTS